MLKKIVLKHRKTPLHRWTHSLRQWKTDKLSFSEHFKVVCQREPSGLVEARFIGLLSKCGVIGVGWVMQCTFSRS